MAAPPFNIAQTTPGDTDIISLFPATERLFRDIVESWLLFEHGASGHHKLKIDTTGNLDLDSTWEAGSLRWSTTLGQLQFASSAGPLVWRNVGPEFPAGTRMLFQQTSAPTGWTKEVGAAFNDAALRNVTGAAATGGATAFSTVFASRTPAGTVGGTALTTANLPVHNHGLSTVTFGFQNGASIIELVSGPGSATNTGNAGSGSTHTHSFAGTAMDFATKFVDTIIATKN